MSYHFFIVNYEPDFIKKARAFVAKLEAYKRDDTNKNKSIKYGDLDEEFTMDEIRTRYNINDAGDIYIFNTKTIAYLTEEHEYYTRVQYKASRGYKKNKINTYISNHHDKEKIKEIVEEIFVII